MSCGSNHKQQQHSDRPKKSSVSGDQLCAGPCCTPVIYRRSSYNTYSMMAEGTFNTTDPDKLTDQELDCLKEAFSLFDTDHDGEITIHELGRVMRTHGFNPSDDELKDMIRNVDKNSNGAIDFNEFIEMMLRRDSKIEEDVAHAFRVFDRDGDGLISAEELKLTMNNLGEPLTDQEVRSMIEEADLDGDGRINFQEFAKLMQAQHYSASSSPHSTPVQRQSNGRSERKK